MADLAKLFETCISIDPAGAAGVDSQLAAVPDKPAVYLLATADDQPIMLASGLAVRSILRRRLAEPLAEETESCGDPGGVPCSRGSMRGHGATGDDMPAPKHPAWAWHPLPSPPETAGRVVGGKPRLSKRADLRPLVRRVYLHATASPFETDLWYLWLARQVFAADPGRYRQAVRPRHCWMIHGDPAGRIPRLTVTDKFDPAGGRRVGPVPDRQSATRLVELLTGLFRLCHYYQVLRQAPQGRACEYREMGRCTGPCDGTITLDAYRQQVADALAFAADGGRAWRAGQAAEMKSAAARLDFESAGRIKERLARAAELDHPRYRWLADMDEAEFLIVQRAQRKARLRSFRSAGGRIVVGPELARKNPAEGLARWMELRSPGVGGRGSDRSEEAGLLADYLFHSDRGRGLFVRYAGQSTEELAAEVQRAFPATPASASQRNSR